MNDILSHLGVEVVTGCQVKEIRTGAGFRVSTGEGIFRSGALILAAGSKAAPATGSDAAAMRLPRCSTIR